MDYQLLVWWIAPETYQVAVIDAATDRTREEFTLTAANKPQATRRAHEVLAGR